MMVNFLHTLEAVAARELIDNYVKLYDPKKIIIDLVQGKTYLNFHVSKELCPLGYNYILIDRQYKSGRKFCVFDKLSPQTDG